MIMSTCARKIPLASAILSILWPVSAWSQTQSPLPGQPAAPAQSSTTPSQTTTSGLTIPLLARDQSKDTQFFALLRARDGQFAYVGELRRIISYHDNLRIRLERFLSDYSNSPVPTREQITADLNTALSRLQTFESNFKAAKEISVQRDLANDFDSEYPLFRADKPIGQIRGSVRINESRFFIQRERTNASEVFQNPSIENREWLTRYETLFAVMEGDVPSLDRQVHLSHLDELPLAFYALAGARSIETMTSDQIQSGIDKYRTALQMSSNDIEPQPRSANTEVRAKILAEVDKIGKDLVERSSDANIQFRDLEKSIAGSARSLYGNKVGAESFNYLLIVFASVFFLIMLIPRIYSAAVAQNILKAEFLFAIIFYSICFDRGNNHSGNWRTN
jgi:hypothetical protein